MASDESLLDNGQTGLPSTALQPANVAERSNGQWNNAAALVQPAAPAGPDFFVYLHAIRRHWLMATGIGLLCAAIAGPAVWFVVGEKYVASSYLKVDIKPESILASSDQAGLDRDRFDIFKNTQQQLVQSRFVLTAALRQPEVARLAIVQRAQQEGDQVTWLSRQLSTSFPGRAEVMQVDIKRPDANDAAILVRAVVDAYLREVVYAEKDKKQDRLNQLDKVYGDKETLIRRKREDLKRLAEELGASASDMLTLRQKLALDQLGIYRGELARSQFDLRRAKAELAAQQATLRTVDTAEMNDIDVEVAAQSDPIARQLSFELGLKKMDQFYTEGAVKAGSQSRYASRYPQELAMLQQQYDARRAELVDLVRKKRRSVILADAQKLEASVAVMAEQEQDMRKEVESKEVAASKFGGISVDVEMMNADIKNLETLVAGIAAEREKLRVEINAAPRIALLGGRAEVPDSPSNGVPRMMMTVLAMLVGLCAPAALVMFWDVQAKHINGSADVSQGLRLPVIGSVPLIPSRVIRRLGSPAKRYQTWHVRLTESVDGIAARVLRKAEMEQCRVIMVSSATSGEGKTTLATQLALSLARTERRTVLVDFDLRRPAFDEIFGLPLEPGVCEVLRGQATVSSLVHQTATKDLAIVTAGRWDRSALASLSNGSAAAMFKQLREEYDFVVVDTSPILPVADARFVSQHVDSVVLSVFRDVSQAPKIQAACEILAAFGVHTVEAVVTGSNSNMYGQRMGYESTISA